MEVRTIKLQPLVEKLRDLKIQEQLAVTEAGLSFGSTPPGLGSISKVRTFSLHDDIRYIDMTGVTKWNLRTELHPSDLTIALHEGSFLSLDLESDTRLINLEPSQFLYIPDGHVLDTVFRAKWEQFDGPAFEGPYTEKIPGYSELLGRPFKVTPVMIVNDCSYILEDHEERRYFLKGF